jgi:hypothetical protein
VVDDRQDLDEAEGGSRRRRAAAWSGSSSAMASRLPPRWFVSSGPQVQVYPAALELELVDLALAVVLAAGLEREQFGTSRELLQLG